jgi:hypothetical protein
MLDLCRRRGLAAARPVLWLAAALCVMSPAGSVYAGSVHAGSPVAVPIDRAELIKLPDRAKTVVIGNPLIADLSIQPGGLAVVTGKGYGATNAIVLDKDGAVLAEHTIVVQDPAEPLVFVYRGETRQTYSCTPDCERRVTLGDTGTEYFDGAVDKDYFAKTIGQTVTRNNQAMSEGAK